MLTRVQRKRTKGYRLPAKTVCCTRPGPLGNPFPTSPSMRPHAVENFRVFAEGCIKLNEWVGTPQGTRFIRALADLLHRVRTGEVERLACYCGLDQECHVDAIIELIERK